MSNSVKFPPVIPEHEAQKGRNLILCFDGTGEEYDKDVTNIVRFFQMLKKGDTSRQMVYYQPGVGTGIKSSSANPFLKKISVGVDAALANGLPVHVRGGYEFLMNNYKEGDRISLFGYSRGAYTARALAGMLQKVGLLPAHNREQIKFAYRNFKKDDEEGWSQSEGFKHAYSINVKIDFVGVFDTVNSVGLFPRELPFAKSNYLIRVFRHALALDERRARFKANLWGYPTESDEKLGEYGKSGKYQKSEKNRWINPIRSYFSGSKNNDRSKTDGCDPASPEESDCKTDVKEVWFAGAHCDVGGGAVENKVENELARIPLRWMVRECFLNKTGILFHTSELRAIGLDPATLWPIAKVPTTSEQKLANVDADGSVYHEERHLNEGAEEAVANAPSPGLLGNVANEQVRLATARDEVDAVKDIHDRLKSNPLWWILEYIPIKQKYRRHDGTWRSWFSINRGKPREIHGQKRFPTYVHRSVLYRKQQIKGYKPKADLVKAPVWVD